MGVYRLFTGQDGESHIEELSAEALEGISLDGAQMNFSVSQREPGAFSDYHPAPRRRWQVGVQGRTIIGLSDGTSTKSVEVKAVKPMRQVEPLETIWEIPDLSQ